MNVGVESTWEGNDCAAACMGRKVQFGRCHNLQVGGSWGRLCIAVPCMRWGGMHCQFGRWHNLELGGLQL
jgi:hypothetical protein